jgi:hypothetical protein
MVHRVPIVPMMPMVQGMRDRPRRSFIVSRALRRAAGGPVLALALACGGCAGGDGGAAGSAHAGAKAGAPGDVRTAHAGGSPGGFGSSGGVRRSGGSGGSGSSGGSGGVRSSGSSGGEQRIAARLPVGGGADSLIGFARWREPQEQVWIGLSGVREVPAGTRPTQRAFSRPQRAAELRSLALTYAPFRLRTGEGELVVFGRGKAAAGLAEQRMVLEWARRVMIEAVDGARAEAFGLVFSWHRGAAAAGLCDEVSVFLDGEVHAGSCLAGLPAREVGGRLDVGRLARLYAWYDRLQPFQADGLQGVRADAALERMIFAGRGKSPANAGEIAAIGELGAQLDRELTAPPPPRPASGRPTSGTAAEKSPAKKPATEEPAAKKPAENPTSEAPPPAPTWR